MKTILLLAAIGLSSISLYGQTAIEPEFIGECLLLKPDQSTVLLEKHMTQTRSAGVIVTGFGSLKSKLQIDGCCSSTKLQSGSDIQFIVRAVDNNTDPMAIIKIFEFDSSKKFRRAELSSMNSFGTVKTNKLHYLNFSAKKYGQNSYLITLKDKPPGEYGITVTNPNALDEKSTVIASFSIL